MKVMKRDIDWFHQSIYMNTVYVNNFCPKELRYYGIRIYFEEAW